MIEGLGISHYTSFAAFIQIAVALNFGFVYLEKRSMLFQLKYKLFATYRAGNSRLVGYASKQLKRYRDTTSYSLEIENIHTKLKDYHYRVTSNWDSEDELRFLPALGSIYGIYSLGVIYMTSLFDTNCSSFCIDLFLTVSLITGIFAILIMLGDVMKKPVGLLLSCISYTLCVVAGAGLVHHGYTMELRCSFALIYHWIVILPFWPIIYYLFRVLFSFIRKTVFLVPMTYYAVLFDVKLDERKNL